MRLVLFCKFPTPGVAKTRLIPALGEEGAAAVHRLLAGRTVEVLQSAERELVEIACTGASEADFRDWLGRDIALSQQVEGDLTARLLDQLEPCPAIFFGADTPDLTTDIVAQAVEALSRHSVVIGPAEDGGYYLIGMMRPLPELFTDMPWSTEQVLPETLRRLRTLEIAPKILPTLSDCDRPEDLARWPWLAE